ncbi:MAG: sigma-54-dependent Fis family transcriptional regulator [Acidobacteria bacterium]|nr:sigma-54-dependent Fis family transcriptional regulator [Acidobacteriota bacterium]
MNPSYSKNALVEAEYQLALATLKRTQTLVVCGASGTGKSHMAHQLHREYLGNKPWVVQHCASFEAGRFESEFFGHSKGAFTGAIQNYPGLLGMARGGSVCLEEISHLSEPLQAKLLRFLETRTYRRVGDTLDRPFEGCLIFTSQVPLANLLASGQIRHDLFYRLASFEVNLLALPERPEDWSDLFQTLLGDVESELGLVRHPQASEWDWLKANWPEGHLHGVRRLLIQSTLTNLAFSEISQPQLKKEQAPYLPDEGSLKADLAACEKRLLERALAQSRETRSDLARKLGISRRALLYKLKEYGLSEKS